MGDRSIGRSVGWLVGVMVGWLVCGFVGWFNGGRGGVQVSWIDWLVDWLVGAVVMVVGSGNVLTVSRGTPLV